MRFRRSHAVRLFVEHVLWGAIDSSHCTGDYLSKAGEAVIAILPEMAIQMFVGIPKFLDYFAQADACIQIFMSFDWVCARRWARQQAVFAFTCRTIRMSAEIRMPDTANMQMYGL